MKIDSKVQNVPVGHCRPSFSLPRWWCWLGIVLPGANGHGNFGLNLYALGCHGGCGRTGHDIPWTDGATGTALRMYL